MYVNIVKNEIKAGGKEAYLEISKRFAKEMRDQPGILQAYALASIEDNIVINIEIWDSEETYRNYDGCIFQKYKQELKKFFIANTSELYYD